MDFSVFMEHVITVSSSASGTDSGGGTSTGYSTRQSGVACSILSPSDSTQERFAQEQLVGQYTFCSYYLDAQRGDKITVTAGPTLVDETFHIVGIKTQPGMELLGIDTMAHYTAERLR